ncbi:MAG: DUF4954 family protein [Marinilabiliaceae bacterium]|nr:DUF4954 family protein [Marinilabiliaceae bacterium]
MDVRNLTPEEIYQLEKQGCHADDWLNVLVHPVFDSRFVWHVKFEGAVTLGKFSDDRNTNEGIYHSRLNNCHIGNHVTINHTKMLRNYDVGDRCILSDNGFISVDGMTSFGNGTMVDVLNETGGRAMPICNQLNAHVAWLLTHFRHDDQFTQILIKILEQEARAAQSARGTIGSGVSIEHCSTIKNVNIGVGAHISGAKHLEEGTILSETSDPTVIGDNVIARHFIIQEGAHILDAAIVTNSFVGQGVRIGRQFSADHSLFFANAEMYHGEACSVFAGPYSASHHKSSLLIAGEFSFFNAGSGTNQSNHMYKLGPMHQGIVERGCKTGSLSYLLWPCKVGPYSVVMGKHTSHFDAGSFPFSYITEEDGKSHLTPAMNLFTVGTRRDIYKWPARDKRQSPMKRDQVIFDLYSPYIIEKVITAIDLLDHLYTETPKNQDTILINGLYINRLMLKTCRKYYELALKVFLGEGMIVLLNHIADPFDIKEVHKQARTIDSTSKGEWLDMAGLFVTSSQVEALLKDCKSKRIHSMQHILDRMAEYYDSYRALKANAFKGIIKERRNIGLSVITVDEIKQVIEDWRIASIKLNNMILNDAQKEFDASSRIGYGINSNQEIADGDFNQVHGKMEENGFVITLKNEIKMINQKADSIIHLLSASQ